MSSDKQKADTIVSPIVHPSNGNYSLIKMVNGFLSRQRKVCIDGFVSQRRAYYPEVNQLVSHYVAK